MHLILDVWQYDWNPGTENHKWNVSLCTMVLHTAWLWHRWNISLTLNSSASHGLSVVVFDEIALLYPLADKTIPPQCSWRGSSSSKWGRTPPELIQEPMLGLPIPQLHGSLLPATAPRFPARRPVELICSKCGAHLASRGSAQISVLDSVKMGLVYYDYDVLTGNTFHITGSLWGEIISHWWIPLTKGQWWGVWGFLWCQPEQTCISRKNVRQAGMMLIWCH